MDRIAARAHHTKIGWAHTYQCDHIFEWTMRAADEARAGVVLDAGAGRQDSKPFFDESLYLAQEHPISGAQAKNIADYDILADVRLIPLKSNVVRVVFSNVAVEHMRYPVPFFEEAFRVLEPGGALFVHVPFVYFEHETPHDYQRPTSFGLTRWYEDAGFERIEIHPTTSSIYTSLWAVRLAMEEEFKRGFGDANDEALAINTEAHAVFDRISKVFDRGAFPGVMFNIGWTGVAYKPGKRPAEPVRLSKPDFLRRNALNGARFVGDAIVVNEPSWLAVRTALRRRAQGAWRLLRSMVSRA